MEMQRHKKLIDLIRTKSGLLAIFALIFILAPIIIQNKFYEDILVLILIWASASQAWNILGGYGGQFSLGHAAFFGIGAYTSTLLYINFALTPWVGMLIGGVLASTVGGIVLYPCFKLRGTYFCLATIAFGEIMRLLCIYFRDFTHGGSGILIPYQPALKNFIFDDKTVYAYLGLALMSIVSLSSYLIKRSRLGCQLIALREEEDAAQSLGINSARCKLVATIISGFFTAIAGSFYAQYLLFVEPDLVFGLMGSIEFALMPIVGGIGTVLGPVLGSLIMVPLDSLLRAWVGSAYTGVSYLLYGIILIVIVRLSPSGIIGLIGSERDKSIWGKGNRTSLSLISLLRRD